MEDEDVCTVPLDDILELDRHELEANETLYIDDTEVLDVPDSCDNLSAQIIDDSLQDIALDSDDEGAKIVAAGSASRKMEMSNKWKSNYLVYKRRRRKNVDIGENSSIQSLTSAKKTNTEEYFEAEKRGPVFYHASEIGMHALEGEMLYYPTGIVEKGNERLECSEKMKSGQIVADADRFHSCQPETNHGERDDSTLIRPTESVMVSKFDSQEVEVPSHMNALDFVDHYLSVNNLNIAENQNIYGGGMEPMNSPSLRAKGALTLARKASLAAKTRELKIYDWNEKELTECHSVKVTDEEFGARSLEQSPEKDGSETQIADAFEFGYDTQMAAEAMEALICAPPLVSWSDCTHEVPKTEIWYFNESAPKSKESAICTNLKIPCPVSRIKKKQLENRNTSYTKLNGDISWPLKAHSEDKKEYKSQYPFKSEVGCREPVTAKSLNCGRPLNVKEVIYGRNVRLVSQQKVDENSEAKNLEASNDNHSSSKFTQCKQCGEDTTVQKFRKSSSTRKRKKCKPSERFAEVSKDPENSSKRSMSNNMEFAAVPKKRRTKSSCNVNIHKSFEREFFNSSSNGLLGVMSSKRIQQGRSNSGLSGTGIPLASDPWCYTKRKRTHKGVPRYSKGSTTSSTLLTVSDDEHKDKHPLKPLNRIGEIVLTRTDCFSLPKTRQSGIFSKQKVGEKNTQPDMIVPRENNKLDALPAGTDASRTSQSIEDCNGPCKKLHSSSFLLKELTRLGYNTKSVPNFIPRALRRRRNENISALFSQHLESNILNQQKKIIARLGFSVASCCSEATHFVTDRFVRTRNMLEAISLGKPVVTHCWLKSCDQANCFVDEKHYILRDSVKERQIGFSMPVTLALARKHPLLMGRRVFITPNAKPGMELIQSLVKSVHGKAVKRIPNAEWNDGCIPSDILILSCEEDFTICMPLLEQGAAIYDSELLLNGIVIQKLEPERHQLFTSYAQSNRSRKRPRKK